MPKIQEVTELNINYNLKELGWNDTLQKEYDCCEEKLTVGRIAVEYKNMYKVYCEKGEFLASVPGKLMYSARGREDYPAVGDWVLLDNISEAGGRATIKYIFNRKSKFARKIAGNTFDEQIVAVNIDILFICMSLNQNYNLRRLERYVIMGWDSGARPVILLTKTDLCDDIEVKLEEVENTAPGVEVLCLSSYTGQGVDELKALIKPGNTVAFLGSSGVGKSTLINTLMGEEVLDTQEVSSCGDRGRHTTTHRELMLRPDGSVVIDTPGMRELHLLDAGESVDTAFEDIDILAANCKFSDCSHSGEPGCAVQAAIEEGTLEQSRFTSYLKLRKEAEYMKRKIDKRAEQSYKNYIKKRCKASR
jgi:ribosome biogenesis GTPase